MNKINLQLSIDEVNRILEALSRLPYKDVFGLINSIQAQASGQLQEQQEDKKKTGEA